MGAKVTVKLECDVCGRIIEPLARSASTRSYRFGMRRRSLIDQLFRIELPDYDDNDEMDVRLEIVKGDIEAESIDSDSGFIYACSPACALKGIKKHLDKMWRWKPSKEALGQ